MLHFIDQYDVDFGETGASLFAAEFGAEYDSLRESNLKSKDLTNKSFSLFERFSYFEYIRYDFIAMNIYDILIGNQDRHPFNWQILFRDDKSFFGPLYDNGASLGWQLSDRELKQMLESQPRMNQYFKRTKVKAGLLEDKQPPLRANHVLNYLKVNYPKEMNKVEALLRNFDTDIYHKFIEEFPLISDIRKEFLVKLINFRMEKLLEILQKEEE